MKGNSVMMTIKRLLVGVMIALLLAAMGVAMAAPTQQGGIPIDASNAGQIQLFGVFEGHAGSVFSLAFSPDGSLLASGGSGRDFTVRVWNLFSGSEQVVLQGHNAQIAAVAFNRNGNIVESASYDGTVKLWDAFSGALLETIDQVGAGEVLQIQNLNTVFSGDGRIVAYGTDSAYGLYVVDVPDRSQYNLDSTADALFGNVGTITLSRDGETLAVAQADNAAVHIIDVPNEQQVGQIATDSSVLYTTLALSPDGDLLATSEEVSADIQLWDVGGESLYALLVGHTRNDSGSLGVYGLAFNPDGSLLASASFDGTVRVWDTESGAQVAVLPVAAGAAAVAWSPDGSRLASADLNGAVQVWGVG